MQELTPIESQNVSYLYDVDVPFVIVKLTSNILHHSIFDATLPLRKMLKECNIHDYDKQVSGDEHKSFVKTHILTFKRELITDSSLYKSRKRGDCRMWLGSSIKQIVEDNDVVAIVAMNQELFVINISHLELEKCVISPIDNPIKEFVLSFS